MLAAISRPAPHQGGSGARSSLGIAAVSGRGEAFKAGGRVVKNVTGYDLPKLLAGSYGTLAALTRHVESAAAPRNRRDDWCFWARRREAVAPWRSRCGSPCDVSAAAHLPGNVAAHRRAVGSAGSAVTALRSKASRHPLRIAARNSRPAAPFGELAVLTAR